MTMNVHYGLWTDELGNLTSINCLEKEDTMINNEASSFIICIQL